MACSQKKAQEEKRTIVFVDEAGFYLLPMAVRTYAPQGQTPVLRVKLTRDHLSAIGVITTEGRLLMQMQDHAYNAQDVVRFLRLLLRKISGKLLVSLRWGAHPPCASHQGFSQARRGQTPPPGALAWLRS